MRRGRSSLKYKEGYIQKGMAIIPAISSTTGAFGCDLLRLFWILATVAVLAGGDGNAEGAAQGAAGQAGLPGVADWRTRRGILFQRFKNRFLIASYEAVAHRILGEAVRRAPSAARLSSRARVDASALGTPISP